VLDLLEIDADTLLSVTTDGKCLIVTPVHDPKREKRFRAALDKGTDGTERCSSASQTSRCSPSSSVSRR
jgi:hypothetical protein